MGAVEEAVAAERTRKRRAGPRRVRLRHVDGEDEARDGDDEHAAQQLARLEGREPAAAQHAEQRARHADGQQRELVQEAVEARRVPEEEHRLDVPRDRQKVVHTLAPLLALVIVVSVAAGPASVTEHPVQKVPQRLLRQRASAEAAGRWTGWSEHGRCGMPPGQLHRRRRRRRLWPRLEVVCGRLIEVELRRIGRGRLLEMW